VVDIVPGVFGAGEALEPEQVFTGRMVSKQEVTRSAAEFLTAPAGPVREKTVPEISTPDGDRP
jgi:hypothetical protein